MDDKPTKRGGGAVVAMLLVAVLALLPMLDVLSIGPMVRLHHVGALPSSWQPALATLFYPLAWTTRHVPVCDTMIGHYIGLWLKTHLCRRSPPTQFRHLSPVHPPQRPPEERMSRR